MTTKIELKKKLATLSRLARRFGKEESLDREMIEIWIEDLEDMTADQFEKAAKWLRKRNKFMPSVAEIYEAVELMREERKESKEYKDLVYRVVSWFEDNVEGWEYATALCTQPEVDEALKALGLPPGHVDANDI